MLAHKNTSIRFGEWRCFLRTAKNGSILHPAVLENWSPFQIATVLLIGKLFDIQLAVIRDEPP